MGLTLALSAGYFGVNASEKKAEPAEKKTEKVVTAPDYLVNKGASFSPRSSVNVDDNCGSSSLKHCVYIPTETGMDKIPLQDTYTESEITSYISAGWLTPHPDSGLALYTN